MTTRAADDSRLSGQTTVAVLLVILAMMVGTAIDVLVRHLSRSIDPHQIMAMRAAIATLILLPILARGGLPLLIGVRPRIQIVRAGFSTASTFFLFVAVAYLPLAEANAYFFAQALFTVPIARLILGERADLKRWLAILIGFAGVVVALSGAIGRPHAELIGVAAALGRAIAAATSSVLLRRMTATERPTTVLVWQLGLALLIFGPIAAFDWTPVSASEVATMTVLAVLVLLVGWLMIQAYRRAETTLIAPALNTALPFGALAGFLVFGEVPEPEIWAGAGLIFAGVWLSARTR